MTDHETWGLEMLASVLVAILCQQQAHTLDIVKTSLWRASGNEISPKTSQIPEMSRFQCASLCLANIRCRRFCHNIVTRTCHVDDVMSSQGQVSLEVSTCFYKITGNVPEMDFSGERVCVREICCR